MLDSLRVFRFVAQHKNFRLAAEEIGLTRPAVSHRIKQLETHFDVQLVERTTRQVSLTPAGRLLAKHAERILTSVAEMDDAMKPMREAMQARLTIGASTLPAEKFLSPALVRLREMLPAPGLQTYVRVGNTEQVLTWLEKREIDLAVVGCEVEAEEFECHQFTTDSLVLVVPPRSSRPESMPAGQPVGNLGDPKFYLPNPVPLEQLKSLPLILREPGSATRQAVLQHLKAHGVNESDLHVVAEMGSADSIMAAVEAGVGCAFFSTNYVQQGRFNIRRIEGIDLKRPLTLCRRKHSSASPQLEAVFDQLPTLLANTLR